MVWTCEKKGRGGGIEDGGKNASDRKYTTGKTKGKVGTVGTERHEKEVDNGSKKLIAGPQITVKKKNCTQK